MGSKFLHPLFTGGEMETSHFSAVNDPAPRDSLIWAKNAGLPRQMLDALLTCLTDAGLVRWTYLRMHMLKVGQMYPHTRLRWRGT